MDHPVQRHEAAMVGYEQAAALLWNVLLSFHLYAPVDVLEEQEPGVRQVKRGTSELENPMEVLLIFLRRWTKHRKIQEIPISKLRVKVKMMPISKIKVKVKMEKKTCFKAFKLEII